MHVNACQITKTATGYTVHVIYRCDSLTLSADDAAELSRVMAETYSGTAQAAYDAAQARLAEIEAAGVELDTRPISVKLAERNAAAAAAQAEYDRLHPRVDEPIGDDP